MMTFWVEGRPVGKERPRMGRGGHFYTPKRTHDYEALVASCYRKAVAAGLHHASPPWVGLVIYHRTKVHPDGDNVIKSVLDAIAHEREENDRDYEGGWTFEPGDRDGVAITII